jgi:RND family efflux transporter MFP subunit
MTNLLRIVLPLLILAIGFGTRALLIASGPKPEQQEAVIYAPLVEVAVLSAENTRVELTAYGEVRPRSTTAIVAEVGARVLKVNPNLYRGAFFQAGEILVELEASDFRNALAMTLADVQKAEAALLLEEAEARVAIADWQELGEGEVPALVAREPQLAAAHAAVSAANANRNLAETNLARAVIRAPFDGRSLQRTVEVGAWVAPGMALASIYAIDAAEVTLPLAAKQLGHLGLALNGPTTPLQVKFEAEVGDQTAIWQGHIVRTEASVDPGTRMVTAIAQIEAPFQASANGTLALAPGMFLRASIAGRALQQVYRVPRSAVLDGDFVRVVDSESKARQIKVQIDYRTISECFVSAGLEEGSQLVISTLPLFVDGMSVKVLASETETGAER